MEANSSRCAGEGDGWGKFSARPLPDEAGQWRKQHPDRYRQRPGASHIRLRSSSNQQMDSERLRFALKKGFLKEFCIGVYFGLLSLGHRKGS